MKVVNERGLVLVGCGFMGRALLEGWLAQGIEPGAITVSDPAPSAWLQAQTGLRINQALPDRPAIVVVATKPQILDKVLPGLEALGHGSTIIASIAAGAPLSLFQSHLGEDTPIVRAMPNLPASVGVGVTALFSNEAASRGQVGLVASLFEAVGSVVELSKEEQLHAVTALSGSGPAYIFALAEALSEAGTALGLPDALAEELANKTVAGAGKMLAAPDAGAEALRVAVTSKGGTTAAGLDVFTAEADGIQPLVDRTMDASRRRSIELSESLSDRKV